jgi:hypothetical protein
MRTEVALHETAIESALMSPSSISAIRTSLNASLTPRRIKDTPPSPLRAAASATADDRTQTFLSAETRVDGQPLIPAAMRHKTAAESDSLDMYCTPTLAAVVQHEIQTGGSASQHSEMEEQVASLQRAVTGIIIFYNHVITYDVVLRVVTRLFF